MSGPLASIFGIIRSQQRGKSSAELVRQCQEMIEREKEEEKESAPTTPRRRRNPTKIQLPAVEIDPIPVEPGEIPQSIPDTDDFAHPTTVGIAHNIVKPVEVTTTTTTTTDTATKIAAIWRQLGDESENAPKPVIAPPIYHEQPSNAATVINTANDVAGGVVSGYLTSVLGDAVLHNQNQREQAIQDQVNERRRLIEAYNNNPNIVNPDRHGNYSSGGTQLINMGCTDNPIAIAQHAVIKEKSQKAIALRSEYEEAVNAMVNSRASSSPQRQRAINRHIEAAKNVFEASLDDKTLLPQDIVKRATHDLSKVDEKLQGYGQSGIIHQLKEKKKLSKEQIARQQTKGQNNKGGSGGKGPDKNSNDPVGTVWGIKKIIDDTKKEIEKMHNWNEYFRGPTGNKFKNSFKNIGKSNPRDQAPIYRFTDKTNQTEMFKEGWNYAPDRLHNDHFEVWNGDGHWMGAANLDGTKNAEKTAQGMKNAADRYIGDLL